MKTRLTSTRWPMSSVGSIDSEGIWYGLTTNAWIPSASPIASATITISSRTAPRPVVGFGISWVPRSPWPRRQAPRTHRPTPRPHRSRLLRLRGLRLGLLGRSSSSASASGLAVSPRRPASSAGTGSASSWLDALGVDRLRLGRLGEDQIVLDAPAALGHSGALADPAAQVVELGPADVAAGDDLEPLDLRRMDGEGPLDADPERLLANGERLTGAAALAGDDDALEDLGPPAGALVTWKCTRTRSPAWKRGTFFSWRCSMLSMIVLMWRRLRGSRPAAGRKKRGTTGPRGVR